MFQSTHVTCTSPTMYSSGTIIDDGHFGCNGTFHKYMTLSLERYSFDELCRVETNVCRFNTWFVGDVIPNVFLCKNDANDVPGQALSCHMNDITKTNPPSTKNILLGTCMFFTAIIHLLLLRREYTKWSETIQQPVQAQEEEEEKEPLV